MVADENTASLSTWTFDLPYLQLAVEAVCEQAGYLPPFLGSTLRGAFGHALKELGCEPGCQRDHHAPGCRYTAIFEPPPAADSLFARQEKGTPAFVFTVPPDGNTSWCEGDKLHFACTLFEPAIREYRLVCTALAQCLFSGLGMNKPASFRLTSAHAVFDDALINICEAAAGGLWLRAAVPHASLTVQPGAAGLGAVELQLDTPLQLRVKKHVLERVSFADVCRALGLRLEALAGFGTAAGARDVRPLLGIAREARVVSDETRFVQWRRYSQRQERGIDLEGIVGKIVFAGPVQPWLPLIQMGAITHLGHGAVWGMGHYTWRWTS